MALMVYVRMLIHRTGGRYDGQEWPPYLGSIDVPDWEAGDMIRHGIAELASAPKLDRGYDVLKVPDPDFEARLQLVGGEEVKEELQETHFVPVDDSDDFDRDFDDDDFDRIDPEPAKRAMKRPTTVENKAKWIEWAVYHGASEATASAQTKAQLIAEYGTL
jgi:hypothetical protein